MNDGDYTLIKGAWSDFAFVNASGTFIAETWTAQSIVSISTDDRDFNPVESIVNIEIIHTAGPFTGWNLEFMATEPLKMISTLDLAATAPTEVVTSTIETARAPCRYQLKTRRP